MLVTQLLPSTLPLVALIVNVLSNFFILSLQPRASVVRSLAASTAVGAVTFASLAWWALPYSKGAEHYDWLLRLACGGLAYLTYSYVFFHFVHIPEASVRIRILQELSDHEPLTEAQILSLYNSSEILALRLRRLIGSGQIVRVGDRYITGRARMLYVAHAFRAAKILLLGKRP